MCVYGCDRVVVLLLLLMMMIEIGSKLSARYVIEVSMRVGWAGGEEGAVSRRR